jgi:DNA-binding response OmpR family regulator
MAKILLIDDDALLVRMYQSKLVEDGFEVEVATDGEPGLKKAIEIKPDLILLDVMMPTVNGIQVLKKLKEYEFTKNIPVILLTNVGGSEEDVEKGLSLGAVAYLVKASYTSKEVIQKIKEVLGGYTAEAPTVVVPIRPEGTREQKMAFDKYEKAEKELNKARMLVNKVAKKTNSLN